MSWNPGTAIESSNSNTQLELISSSLYYFIIIIKMSIVSVKLPEMPWWFQGSWDN